jgi:hypothetical protein
MGMKDNGLRISFTRQTSREVEEILRRAIRLPVKPSRKITLKKHA